MLFDFRYLTHSKYDCNDCVFFSFTFLQVARKSSMQIQTCTLSSQCTWYSRYVMYYRVYSYPEVRTRYQVGPLGSSRSYRYLVGLLPLCELGSQSQRSWHWYHSVVSSSIIPITIEFVVLFRVGLLLRVYLSTKFDANLCGKYLLLPQQAPNKIAINVFQSTCWLPFSLKINLDLHLHHHAFLQIVSHNH